MLAHRLTFKFIPYDEPSGFVQEQYKALRERLAPLLSRLPRGAVKPGMDLDFDAELSPQLAETLLAVMEEIEAGSLARFSVVRLHESLAPADAERAEWFVLRPQRHMDMDLITAEGLHRVKAERLMKGKEALGEYAGEFFVREDVRALVEARGYRGLQTVWVEDVGKYRAPQWYLLQGTAMLGRGVDHPWFDPATLGQFEWHHVRQPTDPQWRYGVRRCTFRQLREGVTADSEPLTRLLRFLRRCQAYTTKAQSDWVVAPPRVLRQFLPEQDFAYLWDAAPVMHESRYRSGHLVCLRDRVRAELMGAKLATADDFEAVIVLDEPPAGCAVLDRAGDAGPGPLFDQRWMKRLRPLERKARAKFDAKPRPEKAADFKPAMAKLKRRAKKDKEAFQPGATPAALDAAQAALGREIPARWRDVLAAADGFEAADSAAADGADVRVAPCDGLPEVHQRNVEMIKLGWPDLPAELLGVADTFFGDAVFLDTSKVTKEGDCPVLLVSHETAEVENTWPSIAVFLEDALEIESDE